MKDLERSSGKGARIDAQMLRAARGMRAPYASTQRLRRRTWWLLTVSFMSSASAAAAAAVTSNTGLALLVAGSASAGAVWYGTQVADAPAPQPARAPAVLAAPQRDVAEAPEPSPPELAPSASVETEETVPPVPAPRRQKLAPKPKKSVETPPAAVETPAGLPTTQADSSLSLEVALLRRARAQLKRKDYKACQATLNEHQRTYRPARLGIEAEVIRIQALAGAGATAAARARARRLLARHPSGLAAERVRPYAED